MNFLKSLFGVFQSAAKPVEKSLIEGAFVAASADVMARVRPEFRAAVQAALDALEADLFDRLGFN